MSEEKFSHLRPVRNLKTQADHRREVFWQITVPLVLGGLVLGVACALPAAVVANGGTLRKWADISLMWVLIPVMIFGVLPLAVFGGLAYGVTRLLPVMPGAMFKLQTLFRRFHDTVTNICDKLVAPIMRAKSVSAQARVLTQRGARQRPDLQPPT